MRIEKKGLFKISDLIIYAVIIIIVCACFLLPFLISKKGSADKFEVYKGNDLLLSYSYETNSAKITGDFNDLVEITLNSNSTLIKIYTNETKSDFNLLEVDNDKKSVCVIESTCSLRKDCVHTPAVKDGKGVIICLPFNIKILPSGDVYIPLISG